MRVLFEFVVTPSDVRSSTRLSMDAQRRRIGSAAAPACARPSTNVQAHAAKGRSGPGFGRSDVEALGCYGGVDRSEMRPEVRGQQRCPGVPAMIEIGHPDVLCVGECRGPQLPDCRHLIGSGDSVAAMAEAVIGA